MLPEAAQGSPSAAGSYDPAASGAVSGIRFEGVTVTYGDFIALDSLTLTVAAGEVVALLGPSGSGKTTALRAVAGFVSPTRGRVHLGERDVTGLPPYERGLGMVVQQYALFPHMRVSENVAFGLRARGAPRADIAPRVDECLHMVGMAGFAHRYPSELSGGQQQRVAVARALAIRPKVLLLDEPLSALDAQLRSGMINELARLHRELPDVAILYVTHDQIEALTLADRIGVMNHGRLVDIGAAHDLYRRPPSTFTAGFIGNANLLPATVEDMDAGSGHARVRVGEWTLTVGVPGGAAPGNSRLLCVRPHSLALEPRPEFENRIEGTVTEVQWRGAMHRIYLDVDGHEVRVDITALGTPPRRDERIAVHFSAADATLIED